MFVVGAILVKTLRKREREKPTDGHTGYLDRVEFGDGVWTDTLGEDWIRGLVQQVPHIYSPVRLGYEEDSWSGGTPSPIGQLRVVAL